MELEVHSGILCGRRPYRSSLSRTRGARCFSNTRPRMEAPVAANFRLVYLPSATSAR